MQQIQSNTSRADQQQLQLNDFQNECRELLKSDTETMRVLREIIREHLGQDGLITITKVTRGYLQYLRKSGLKVKDKRPLINFLPMNSVIETLRDNPNQALIDILTHYRNLSSEDKMNTFLFRFQLPSPADPSRSLQNYQLVMGLGHLIGTLPQEEAHLDHLCSDPKCTVDHSCSDPECTVDHLNSSKKKEVSTVHRKMKRGLMRQLFKKK